jgi:hypothetical protein
MNDKVESPNIKYGRGSYFVPAGRKLWPHEIKSAEALAGAGYTVKFLDEAGDKTVPDAEINGMLYELKSPKTDKLNQIQNNLKKANRKTPYIIIESCRIIKLPDSKVQKYLAQRFGEQRTIRGLLYINRRREIVDISSLV